MSHNSLSSSDGNGLFTRLILTLLGCTFSGYSHIPFCIRILKQKANEGNRSEIHPSGKEMDGGV
jgi:hypothetical protein